MARSSRGDQLTLKEKQVLAALLANPNKTFVEIEDMMGQSRCTITKMKTYSPFFREAYDKALNDQWAGSRNIAQDTMINLAKNGDRQASEFILKSLGLGEIQRIEADVTGKVIKVTVEDD